MILWMKWDSLNKSAKVFNKLKFRKIDFKTTVQNNEIKNRLTYKYKLEIILKSL
jgi:hypothetical protein